MKEARRRGVKLGRKKKLSPAQIAKARKLIDVGERFEDVAVLWNVRPYDALPGACRLKIHSYVLLHTQTIMVG